MRLITFAKGLGMGAALMYYFDPERGVRRRALVRDKMIHTTTKLGKMLNTASRDLTNRAGGLTAELQSLFSTETPTDTRVGERVRARLGHVVSHPGRIQVAVHYGVVTLSGSVLASEWDSMLRTVASTRGVVGVRNELMASSVAGADPEHMGEVIVMKKRNAPLHWSPATRIVVGTAGGALALFGKKQGGMLGGAVSALGFGLLTRSLTNTAPVRTITPAPAPSPPQARLPHLTATEMPALTG